MYLKSLESRKYKKSLSYARIASDITILSDPLSYSEQRDQSKVKIEDLISHFY